MRASAIFLVSGAIVSWMIAWTCAYFSPFESDDYFMYAIQHEWTAPKPRWWPEWDASDPRPACADDGFQEDRAYGFGIRYVVWKPSYVFDERDPAIDYGTAMISVGKPGAVDTAAGWPLYCLRGQQFNPLLHPDLAARGRWAKRGILLDRRARHRYANWGRILMPLDPIWTGLLVDAMFYGGLLWLVTLGPRTARRLVRRARGRCTACGYRLTGLTADRCPECGCEATRSCRQGTLA